MKKNDNLKKLLAKSSLTTMAMSDDEIKFHLFLKSRELKQISLALQRVMLKEKSERQAWVEENQKIIENLVKVFSEDSSLSLDAMSMDDEAAVLSLELADNLKKTISIINTLFYGVEDLEG